MGKEHKGWHALRNEGRGGRTFHALRSSGRATRSSVPSSEYRALIHYRAFRNQDLPALAEIWRAQAPERALMQPMSADLFESHVLSKPYFDSRGLIVALDDGAPVGFAHAGFGPNSDESGLSTQLGVADPVAAAMLEIFGAQILAHIATQAVVVPLTIIAPFIPYTAPPGGGPIAGAGAIT